MGASLLGELTKGTGAEPGLVGRDLCGAGAVFLSFDPLLYPASRTMAPWTAQCPCTLLIVPLLTRLSWGYEETAR
jgi:hypothetical protein